MEKAQCSRGWTARCARSKGAKCTCACGGANHGNPAARLNKISSPEGKYTHVATLIEGESGSIRGDVSTREVYIDGDRIDPAHSQSLRNHSPDGFSWGYGGSGPAQLALAILLRFVAPEEAQQLYQGFKFGVIAGLPQDADFDLPIATVRAWLRDHPINTSN